MPGVIRDFAKQAEVFEIVRGQPPQWEDLPVGPTCKKHQEHDGKQKRWDCIGGDDHAAGPGVKTRAIAQRLANAHGDGNHIGDQGRPEPERDRHRHFFKHQLGHINLAKIALAKVKLQVVDQHLAKTFQRRLIQAKLFFQLLNELRRQALTTSIAVVGFDHGAATGIPTTAGKALKHVTTALKLRDHLLHRATGNKLHQGKIYHHDAKQCWDHQQ